MSEIPKLKELSFLVYGLGLTGLSVVKFFKKNYHLQSKLKFKHGKCYKLPNGINLISCYHPSPRNVNTKLISEKMMITLFKKVKNISTI